MARPLKDAFLGSRLNPLTSQGAGLLWGRYPDGRPNKGYDELYRVAQNTASARRVFRVAHVRLSEGNMLKFTLETGSFTVVSATEQHTHDVAREANEFIQEQIAAAKGQQDASI